jgi:crotonobetainyl-CoA:carnitine CoA-transferase CaiB-like acyl-CoA transferase
VDALMALLGPPPRLRTAHQWFEALTPLGVPCGPVNDLAGAFDLAANLGLEPVVAVDGLNLVANPIRLSRTPATCRLPPPPLD